MPPEKPSVSFFFPVYNDAATVENVTRKALHFLQDVAEHYEIIIINDGSPDASGAIADQLAQTHPAVKVIHHPKNLGYGAALKNGFKHSQYEYICFTDGDDEYDVYDFYKLFALRDYYDLIITFRYVKMYSGFRQCLSWGYNMLFRIIFHTRYRDIGTGLRMVRKSALQNIEPTSDSPFIGAEITIKMMLKGFRIGEVGIQTFPRTFNKGASVSWKNVISTIKDMWRIYHQVFNPNYDLPPERTRQP